jgi:hypothetical protein
MARIRTIKPEFWTDGKIVQLSPWARLFFIGMWNFALCDHGHVVDDADALKLRILPSDGVDGAELIDELINAGRVARVMISDGRTFLHVPRLIDHQNVDKRWSPRCPVCNESQVVPVEPYQTQGNSYEFVGDHVNSAQERKVKEGKEDTSSSASRKTPSDDPDFAKFWSVYPRRVGKGEARKAWLKLVKAGVDPADLIAGAERYRDDPRRKTQDIKFTKHPGPWLNAERWTDQLDHASVGGPSGWWDN